MIDASDMSYRENINHVKRISKQLKKIRKGKDIFIESELGVINDKNDEEEIHKNKFTNPEQVNRYLSETGVDLLAISVGNRHGFVRPKPPLEKKLLARIHQKSNVPLILHGGDWISLPDLKFAKRNGVRKINIGPKLRLMAGETIKLFSDSSKFDVTDHRKLLAKITDSMCKLVSRKFQIFQ